MINQRIFPHLNGKKLLPKSRLLSLRKIVSLHNKLPTQAHCIIYLAIHIFHQQNLESILAKVQARNDYELDCSPYEGSSNAFAEDLDHLSTQKALSFALIQKLLNHWASSSHQRILAMRSKLVYQQQQQLSMLALWGCIDKLLLDAWKSHDSFLNPLRNLFPNTSSLLRNNQNQCVYASDYLLDWPNDCVANFRPYFPRVDPTDQALINVC